MQKHFLPIYHWFLWRPLLRPQKVSGLFSSAQARRPESPRALLLAAGPGLKPGLDQAGCYPVPPGTKFGSSKMAVDSLSPALSSIIFPLGYRAFF